MVTANWADLYDDVQGLYVAYFGRPADPWGRWNLANAFANTGAFQDGTLQEINALYDQNATVRSLVDSFGTSAESNALYTGDTRSFVSAIYQNLFNRAPDTGGLDFWSNAIDSGSLTKGHAALAILCGALSNTTAQGQIDTAIVTNKIATAENFTANVNTQTEIQAYAGDHAADLARDMLHKVTATTNQIDFAPVVVQTIGQIVYDYQHPQPGWY